MAEMVPSVIGDQTETAGVAGHGRNPRTRASPAEPLAWAAYARVVILVVLSLVDIRGFIRPCRPGAVN